MTNTPGPNTKRLMEMSTHFLSHGCFGLARTGGHLRTDVRNQYSVRLANSHLKARDQNSMSIPLAKKLDGIEFANGSAKRQRPQAHRRLLRARNAAASGINRIVVRIGRTINHAA
jgi:hypothetical protein